MNDSYDLTPVEIPKTLGGKPYVLVEASAGAAKAWRNASAAGVRVDDGKIVGFDKAVDADYLLVSLCLFELKGDQRVPVKLATVLEWPERIVRPMFKQVRDISQLEEVDDERKQLYEALSTADAPVTLAALHAYVKELDATRYRKLELWLRPSDEERLPNVGRWVTGPRLPTKDELLSNTQDISVLPKS